MKFISCLGVAACLTASLSPVAVNSAEQNPVIGFDENGFAFNSYDNKYIIDSREIIKGVFKDRTYLFTLGNSLVYEYDELPADEELPDLVNKYYSKEMLDALNSLSPYDEQHSYVCLLINNGGNPYVVRLTKDGTLKNTDIYPYIRYELDGMTHQLKDYSTQKTVVQFENKGVNNNFYSADGCIYIGNTNDQGVYYIREVEYFGSGTKSADFGTYYETAWEYRVQTSLADLNLDGNTDVTDLTIMSLNLIGDNQITALQNSLADLDNDNAVTLADLAKFRQYLSKKIEQL